jgi:hypothetical protein
MTAPRQSKILESLIVIAERAIAKPHTAFADKTEIADLAIAIERAVIHAGAIDDASVILAIAIRNIAEGDPRTVRQMRFVRIAREVLPIVRNDLFVALQAEREEVS